MSIGLYIQTEYSILESTIRIEKLVHKAKVLGYKSVAITDSFMHGGNKFYQECMKENIKPIFGLKVKVESEYYESSTMLVYAKNLIGYKALMQLSSIQQIESRLIKIEELKKLQNDLYFISAGKDSDIDKLVIEGQLELAKKVYFENVRTLTNFYIGLENSAYMDTIYSIGDCVVIDKVTYLEEKDYKYLSYLHAIKDGKKHPELVDTKEYLKTIDELKQIFGKYTNAIKNMADIDRDCNVKFRNAGLILPKFPNDKGLSSKDYLLNLCKLGLTKRLKNFRGDTSVYSKRILYELEVINKMGFNDYFLIVFDFIRYAKQKGIFVGPGRGSAAGSLVSYALGITNVDPIKYDLLFERFLNPERITMPDIDIDFPDDRRDEVIQYVADKYGKDYVCHIGTFSTLQSKSSIRDVARVMDIDKNKLERVLEHISSNSDTIRETVKGSDALKELIKDKEILELIEVASNIEGLVRQTGTHAAGIIISDEPLYNYTALTVGNDGVYQSQLEASDLEASGLLKIDFLGLKNLSTISQILQLIKENEGIDLDINNISMHDELTFENLSRGETTGVFQLESSGMRNTLRKMQCNSFNDIVAALALFRPGPMENIDSFCNRKLGKEKVTYPHPELKKILDETYGIIVYQEQIMRIAEVFAGYSLGEADLLRRAMSKKDMDTLTKERTNFVSKSTALGYDTKVANEIYDYIVKFANYGFNKSHSVAYAVIAYQLAYLKANYITYFMAVLLSSVVGSEKQISEYIVEAKKYGINILPPSINQSKMVFTVEGTNIRFPLVGIRSIGFGTSSKILEIRSNGRFINYKDYLRRVGDVVNKKVQEMLVDSGALDEFGMTRKDLLQKANSIENTAQFANSISEEELIIKKISEELELDELIRREKDALGVNIKYSRLMQYDEFVSKNKLEYLSQINEDDINTSKRLIAVIKSIKVTKTKKGEDFAILELEDNAVTLDGILFPEGFKKFGKELKKGQVIAFLAKVDTRYSRIQLVLDNIKIL